MKTVLLTSALLTLSSAEVFMPHKVALSQLSSEKNGLLEALTGVGMVSITDIPGYADLRVKTLTAATNCAMGSKLRGHSYGNHFVFPDGTNRYTLGSQTQAGVAEAFSNHGLDGASAACAEFAANEKEFRAMVDSVAKEFISVVDELQGHDGSTGRHLLEVKNGRKLYSFADIVDAGVQLEHFHTYEKEADTNTHEFTLDLHVDQGMFIALAPALVLNGEDEFGFHIQLPNGEVAQPDFGTGDELVFMIGDGVSQWVNPSLNHPLRATPHAMTMPSTKDGSALRSWYGRMFLPHADAYLESQQKTFGEVREDFQSKMPDVRDRVAVTACSDGFVLRARDLQAQCSGDQVFCWMACMATVSCDEGEEAKCAQTLSDGTVAECVDETAHNSNCSPKCVAA